MESSTPVEVGIEHRRSTRMVLAVPITVRGFDALHEPFAENTNTVMVSCHGCKYQSKHYVPRGSLVEMEISRDRRDVRRKVSGKVIWVQRPRNAREVFHVGIDFEVPGNVWGVPSPPADWFPVPGEPELSSLENDEAPALCPPPSSGEEIIEDDCETTSWDESEIVSSPKTVHEIQAEIAVEAEEANIAEMEIVSGESAAVDPEIRALIEKTVKAAMARLAKSIAEEARNERMAVAAQLDAKVQQAVEAAMTRLPSLQLKKSKRRN
jgi:hypothetical protein